MPRTRTKGSRRPPCLPEIVTTVAAGTLVAAVLAGGGPLATALSAGAAAAGAVALLAARSARNRLLDAAGIVRITIDRRGEILEWSRAGETVFGWSRHEVLGRNVTLLMPAPFAEEHDRYLERFVQDPRRSSRVLGVTRHVRGKHRDGTEMALSLFVQQVRRRGEIAFEGLLLTIPDAGGHPHHPAGDEMAPQISWRWLRNLGHEIRTPMAGIQGHAEILVDLQTTPQEREASATAILRNSEHLVELLNDLLDHARLAAGELPVRSERVNVHGLLRDACAVMRANAERKGLELEVDIDPLVTEWVTTDPLRLRQILLNLLGNAVKFTRRGWVRLEVSAVRTDATTVLRCDVADTGQGIAAEFAPMLFQPFQQEARTQQETQGSGLGLSICRRLARMLGGELSLVDSVPGVGSRFRLQLPMTTAPTLAVPDSRPGHARVGDGKPLAGRRIAVVDDAKDLLLVTRRFLEAAGAEVLSFGDPHEALADEAAIQATDLALLDLMMPGISGFELARRLLDHGFAGPVVAFSADGDTAVAERCREAGFTRLLHKPIGRTQLVDALTHTLAAARR